MSMSRPPHSQSQMIAAPPRMYTRTYSLSDVRRFRRQTYIAFATFLVSGVATAFCVPERGLIAFLAFSCGYHFCQSIVKWLECSRAEAYYQDNL